MVNQTAPSIAYTSSYKFSGKKLDTETDLYDYGTRYYDPKISVWMSVNPLAEKGYYSSPYSYVGNNPIIYIDPNGMLCDKYYGEDGSLLHDTRVGNREFILKTTTTKEKLLEQSTVNPDLIADVDGISKANAIIASKEVSAGNICGIHMSNFVELDPKSARNAMYENFSWTPKWLIW